jgi:hypothetical protein
MPQSSTILYTRVCITAAHALEVNDFCSRSSKTHTLSTEKESPDILRNTEFNQWKVANSRCLDDATSDSRLKVVSNARVHYGLDQDAVSSIYDRQAARKRAVYEKIPLSKTSTAVVGGSIASHNRQTVLHSTANPPGNQSLEVLPAHDGGPESPRRE